MIQASKQNEQARGSKESSAESWMSRRGFLQILSATPLLGIARDGTAAGTSKVAFTIVNHWHQCGVGWLFQEGKVGDKHYERGFSIFYGVQKTIDATQKFPWLTIGLEFDSYAYEVMQAEDKQFVQEKFRPLVEAGRIEPVGGTYTQPYSQIVGWQSNVRQFVEGRAVVRELLGKDVDCFLVEEIIFHPQMPQLLRLSGFPYASLEVQNNGSLPLVKKAVVNWQGLDGTTIPTIPYNPWLISLVKQNQSLASYVDPTAEAEEALLTIWAEIWPPGLDWGASYLPYTEGFQSLRSQGLQSLGFGEYMRRRCKPGTVLESKYWKMDDPEFTFGWPQNKTSGWATLGGWGYEGDALLKENHRLEHQMNAAELLLSLAPDSARTQRLRDLWKLLMRPQNHDCFIVSGFESEYEHVFSTNLEVARMMSREVEAGLTELRQEAVQQLAAAQRAESASVICQNPAGVPVRQPISLEMEPGDEGEYFLENGDARLELQRMESVYANGKSRHVAVVDLPACGFKAFGLKKGHASTAPAPPKSESIANEYYTVKWDQSRKGFDIQDREKNRSIIFRPFSGDITHVMETRWNAPNSGVRFRAKNFSEVSYVSAVEAAGPAYHAVAARGNLVTLSTTEEPAAWVSARAVLYRGIRKVDVITELHVYPQLKFLAMAELELAADQVKSFRDFPFGEEEGQKEQMSALNYVRLQSPGFAVNLAHGGTQQFFYVRTPGHFLLKNMIAHGTLKGSYQWIWSVTTGSAFTASESYRLAEASWGPIVQRSAALPVPSQSWVSVNDPAMVIFRLGADSGKLSVWLMNYSDEHKHGELNFTVPLHACRRVNFEGNAMTGVSAVLDKACNTVKLDLSPWEIAAIDLDRG